MPKEVEGLLGDERGPGAKGSITLYLLFCAVTALIPSFHFGYQVRRTCRMPF